MNHGRQQLEQVQSFKFLGSYKTATGDCSKDIKIRAALAPQKATELTNIWKDRNIKKSTESQSHETDGEGSIPTWCGRIDNQEVGQK